MNELALSSGGRGWHTARGNLGIWTPGTGLLIIQMRGHGSEEFVAPVTEALDKVLGTARPVRVFFDLGKMQTYDSPLRTKLTARFAQERDAVTAIDILIQSKMVAMGVAVANLALRGLLHPHTTRLNFDLALDTALKTAGVANFSSKTLLAA